MHRSGILCRTDQPDSGSDQRPAYLTGFCYQPEKLSNFDDLLFLAETACIQLTDSQPASRLYASAEGKATDNRQLSRLATSLNQLKKDSAWASRVLRKIA